MRMISPHFRRVVCAAIVAAVAIAVLLIPAAAFGQTYVRPSKGATFQILAVPANASGFVSSASYDWTGFYELQLAVVASAARCTRDLEVQVVTGSKPTLDAASGATDAAAPFSHRTLLFDGTRASYTYLVGNLSAYLRIQATKVQPVVLRTGATNCSFTLSAVPMPFGVSSLASGPYAEGTPYTHWMAAGGTGTLYPLVTGALDGSDKSNASGGTIEPLRSSDHALLVTRRRGRSEAPAAPVSVAGVVGVKVGTIADSPSGCFLAQNVGTSAALCRLVDPEWSPECDTLGPTLSAYQFVLRSGEADADGVGGTQSLCGLAPRFLCCATRLGGSTSVSWTTW